MAKYSIKNFNYIASGKTARLVSLDIVDDTTVESEIEDEAEYSEESTVEKTISCMTYVASIEENDDTMVSSGSSNAFSARDNDVIVHCLYDINDVCHKTNAKTYSANSQNSQDICTYGPQLTQNGSSFIQKDAVSYVLNKDDVNLQARLGTDLIAIRKNVEYNPHHTEKKSMNIDSIRVVPDYIKYHKAVNQYETDTYIYVHGDEKEKYDMDVLSNSYKIQNDLLGQRYNIIYEVNQNAQNFNDYEEGDIYSEYFIGKNAYDPTYSMDISIDYSSNAKLSAKCFREYAGIGIAGGDVFLKYYDSISSINTASNNSNYVIQYRSESGNAGYSYYHNYTYQKIETVHSVNRFKLPTQHKTNLYTVQIKNDRLAAGSEEAVKAIKNDIRSNIREIVKNICPVNTQLFDVEFVGRQS